MASFLCSVTGSQHISLFLCSTAQSKAKHRVVLDKENFLKFFKKKQRERKESKRAECMLKCVKSFLVFCSVRKIIVSGFAPRLFKLLMEKEKA